MSYPAFPKTVRECAELLDEVMPDWYTKIDERKLNLTSCSKCIIGQLYGGYGAGMRKLFRESPHQIKDEQILCINYPYKQQWLAQIALRKAASGPITFSTQGKRVAIPGTMMNQGMADLLNKVEAMPALPLITPASFTLNIGADTLNLLTGANAVRKDDVPALISTLEQIIKELRAI